MDDSDLDSAALWAAVDTAAARVARARSATTDDDHRGEVLQPVRPFKSPRVAIAAPHGSTPPPAMKPTARPHASPYATPDAAAAARGRLVVIESPPPEPWSVHMGSPIAAAAADSHQTLLHQMETHLPWKFWAQDKDGAEDSDAEADGGAPKKISGSTRKMAEDYRVQDEVVRMQPTKSKKKQARVLENHKGTKTQQGNVSLQRGGSAKQGDRFTLHLSDLKLDRGIRFQREILQRFSSSVHHPSSSLRGAFFVLVFFRRHTFALTEDSVGLALHSILGGSAGGFHVRRCSGNLFSFAVASKEVGNCVLSLKRVITEHFDVYFSPAHEENKAFNQPSHDASKAVSEDDGWILVTRKKNRKKMVSKSVSFATQPVASPIRKHRPSLGGRSNPKSNLRKTESMPRESLHDRSVTIGSVVCPILNSHHSNQNLKIGVHNPSVGARDLISAKHVFDSLKVTLNSNLNRFSGKSKKSQQAPCNLFLGTGNPLSEGSNERHKSKCCYRCLSPNHLIKWCSGPLRCRRCLATGHIERSCREKANGPKLVWRPKNRNETTDPSAVKAKEVASSETEDGVSFSRAAIIQEQQNLSASWQLIALPACTTFSTASSTARASTPSESSTMANFVIDPRPYVPAGMEIEDGGPQRRSRARVHFGAPPERLHEEWVIAEDTHEILDAADYDVFANQIRIFLQEELQVDVLHTYRLPFGIAMFELGSLLQRDRVFADNPHLIDGVIVRFNRHDRALNHRDTGYTRQGWILMLGFPLDFMESYFINQAVASFGTVIRWHNSPRIRGYVLVKCMYKSVRDVPRSIICIKGEPQSGQAVSWTVPTYVLNADLGWPLGNPLANLDNPEDGLPPGGNPHPLPEDIDAWEGEIMEDLVNQNLAGLNGGAAAQGNQAQQQAQPPPPQQQQDAASLSSGNLHRESGSSSSTSASNILQRGMAQEYQMDLPLLDENNVEQTPEWIRHMVSQGLKNLLSTAYPLLSATAWWKRAQITLNVEPADLIALRQQLDQIQPSQGIRIEEIHERNDDIIGTSAQMEMQPVVLGSEHETEVGNSASQDSNINELIAKAKDKQCITQVYTRKKKKADLLAEVLKVNKKISKKSRASTSSIPIEESCDPARPESDNGLRRSERLKGRLQGYRHAALPLPENNVPKKKRSRATGNISKGMTHTHPSPTFTFDGPVKFPSLSDLLQNEHAYPEIDSTTLQKVAVEKCGVPSEEAAVVILGQEQRGKEGELAALRLDS